MAPPQLRVLYLDVTASPADLSTLLPSVATLLAGLLTCPANTGPDVWPAGPSNTPVAALPARVNGRASRVVPGSVPDRVLAILTEAGEPLPLGPLIAGAKAGPHSTRRAVHQLVADGRIRKTGASRGTRYSLAGKAR